MTTCRSRSSKEAKERIMDTLGAAIAGSVNWEYAAQLREACRELGTGDCGVIGGENCYPAAMPPW